MVGGANIDIGGRSFDTLIQRDSNPGTVGVSLGGVGRNIAHALSLLGVSVRLVTALGEDHFAEKIRRSCAQLGIDLSCSNTVDNGRTSVYLYISGCDGDMAAAVSDMEICKAITPEHLHRCLPVLNDAELIVVDTNIPHEALCFLADNIRKPLFVDPVSIKKSAGILPVLNRVHTLKTNKIEGEALSGVCISNEKTLCDAASVLLSYGLTRVFITLGEKGALAADGKEMLFVSGPFVSAHSATGAGDVFMAAVVRAFTDGWSLDETCRYASAAASLTVESDGTVDPELSDDRVKNRAQDMSVRALSF